MNTVEVLHQLERLHPNEVGEWSFHREVFGIDAYAIRLWHGDKPHYRRVAYEVKVSRSDFLNELKAPAKRRTAIALSHQYYLAMPAELAERCLAEVMLHMPECGLLAIYPEAQTGGWRFRSPCVGAASTGTVRMLKRAPITSCRGWTAREWSNLMRRQHRPDPDAVELRQRVELAEHEAKDARRKVRVAEERLNAAHAAVRELYQGKIEPGQVWVGPHRGVTVRATVDPPSQIQLTVVGATQNDWQSHVWVNAGEFLSEWKLEPAELQSGAQGG